MKTPLRQIFYSFFKVGALLFGGGYAMLPLLEREVVTRRQWSKIEQMSDYYAMAQLVPGVIAINTAMLIGHHLRGAWGSVVATLGVVAAPFFAILAYALAFDSLRHLKPLEHAMAGLRPAVAGMMAGVAYTMFMRNRKTPLGCYVALGTAFLTLVCQVPAIFVILAGVGGGLIWHLCATKKNASNASPQ